MYSEKTSYIFLRPLPLIRFIISLNRVFFENITVAELFEAFFIFHGTGSIDVLLTINAACRNTSQGQTNPLHIILIPGTHYVCVCVCVYIHKHTHTYIYC